MNAIIPKSPITIREATASDIPFIDSLQKMHSRQVGWMPTKQLEAKIAAKQILVASSSLPVASEEQKNPHPGPPPEYRERGNSVAPHLLTTSNQQLATAPSRPSAYCLPPTPTGYCIAQDQYFKRDDVGIIYQMNVVPGAQRGLVGASLLKAQFERSAWGCKLYCCWCAQDIAANRFWEAMGFVPLAFRTGSEKKSRVHIFWQRRIRAGDVTTPYWFPAQTSGGSIREDRLVLPIPPGTHWSDAKPMVLPGEQRSEVIDQNSYPGHLALTDICPLTSDERLTSDLRPLTSRKQARNPKPTPQASLPKPALSGKLQFAAAKVETPMPKATGPEQSQRACPEQSRRACPEQSRREPRKKRKNDPKLVAAARELRDRWLEQVNSAAMALDGGGKYDVSRMIQGSNVNASAISPAVRLLEAA